MFEVEPRIKDRSNRAYTIVLLVVLAVLVVVGTIVEIAYYNELSEAMSGVEHEREELRSENNMLREMVLQEVGDNNRMLRQLIAEKNNTRS